MSYIETDGMGTKVIDTSTLLAETARLREQLKVAVGALENISKNETMPSRVLVCPRIDGRAYEAKQALAQIKDLEK